jgi:hypothetical protein
MFKSICKRAIGRVSRQAVVSGAEVLRRGLVVLMLLVTASVMLNLAAPGEANAAPTQAPTVTASLSDSTILPGGTTTLTLVITNTASYAHGVMAIGEPGFLRYDFPAGVVVGAGLVTSNTCGIDIRSSAITDGQFDVLAEGAPGISGLRNPGLSAGQSCTFSVVLTAASPGVFSFDDLPIGVQSSGFTSGTGYGHIGALTVTAPPADPTPVLTFDHEVTSALVGQDFALPATSTVTAPGAGAITYSSSDTNVAVVAPETGYVTAVAIGEVTITALQAAAAGVNAEATATMTFTVEPRTPTVTSLSVTSGPQTGGTTVVLTGTNLDIISDIYFGSNATSVITVNSDTEVVVVSPAGAEGAVNVTVVTPFGTSAPDAGNLFTYDPLPPPPPAPDDRQPVGVQRSDGRRHRCRHHRIGILSRHYGGQVRRYARGHPVRSQ